MMSNLSQAEQLASQVSYMALWVPGLPIIACFTLFLCQVFLPARIRDDETYRMIMKTISILAIGLAAVIATFIFYQFWMERLPVVKGSQVAARLLFSESEIAPGASPSSILAKSWFSTGAHEIKIGVLLDNMSATVLFMVAWVAALIQIFSWGYMEGEKHIVRYFCFHSLFVASMLGMVISDNFLTFIICWELMGLCSYLLIGFFWKKRSAMNAQKKAFLVTRVGDLGFFLGVFLLMGVLMQTGQTITFRFEDIAKLISEYTINTKYALYHLEKATLLGFIPWFKFVGNKLTSVPGIPMYLLTASALLIFMGTIGKSAQFPLHIWLPDAMEGPTPVSALIHAATMVAAGVYLVARTYFIFDPLGVGYSPALMIVAFIGAFTAFMAATIGVTQYDIKRVLAYSTISQLGYMVMALGVGAMGAALFHLTTHAFFKALLFLGSGAVIFGSHHIQDMRYMGGLRKYMPLTFVTFVAGTLALIGFPGTSGYFSKDMILEHAFMSALNGHPELWIVFILGISGAVLTCFYMTRQIWMVFFGQNRREQLPEEELHNYHVHSAEEMVPFQASPVMYVPLIILAVFAIFAGYPVKYGHPDLFNSYLYQPKASHASSQAYLVTDTPITSAQGGERIPGEVMSREELAGREATGQIEGQGEIHSKAVEQSEESLESLAIIPQILAPIAALLGIFLGWFVFFRDEGRRMKDSWKQKFAKLYDIVFHKYYCDEYIQEYIVEPFLVATMLLRAFDMYVIDGFVNLAANVTVAVTKIARLFDEGIIDGMVNGVAWIVDQCSQGIKYFQSGYVQNYFMAITVCVLGYIVIESRDTLINVKNIIILVLYQLGLYIPPSA